MELTALRAALAAAIASMRALVNAAQADGGRDLTAEEQAQYDAELAKVEPLKAKIKRLEDLNALEAEQQEVRPAAARGQAAGASAVTHAPGDPAAREFESFGQFMAAVRFNPSDSRLDYQEFDGERAVLDADDPRAEMRMDTGSAGGFMVPQQFRETIMRVDPESALIRPGATVMPAGTPPDAAITIPALDQSGDNPANMYGGVQVTWIAEGAEKPETDAGLREITLTPHEVAATIKVTDKLLRNWPAAGAFLETLLRGAVTQAEDLTFIQGNGIGKPLGLLNASGAIAVNRATASSFTYADAVGMVAVMLMRGGTPVWLMSQAMIPSLLTMKDEADQLLFPNMAMLGPGATLLGYPIRWNNRQPGKGSKGDVMLVDRSYYLVKDGSGPFVATSEHVHFTSNKTVVKIFWNVDGRPWLTQPLKEENGFEVSPFVILDVPA